MPVRDAGIAFRTRNKEPTMIIRNKELETLYDVAVFFFMEI